LEADHLRHDYGASASSIGLTQDRSFSAIAIGEIQVKPYFAISRR
jgi:hypothetical protein